MRIFLDANILFSAAKSDGAMRAFLDKLRVAGHALVVDGYVTGEARRNLESKFPKAISDFDSLLGTCEASDGVSWMLSDSLVTCLVEKDRPVLAAAIQHKCDVLMTGDKAHFGHLFGEHIQGVAIYSPAGLARQLDPHSAR